MHSNYAKNYILIDPQYYNTYIFTSKYLKNLLEKINTLYNMIIT